MHGNLHGFFPRGHFCVGFLSPKGCAKRRLRTCWPKHWLGRKEKKKNGLPSTRQRALIILRAYISTTRILFPRTSHPPEWPSDFARNSMKNLLRTQRKRFGKIFAGRHSSGLPLWY